VASRSEDLTPDARIALHVLETVGTTSVAELRAEGVQMPAQALYALQLAGYPVRRSSSNVWRLAAHDEPVPPPPPPKPRVRRIARTD
jgi:hypothetical protein